MLSSKRSTMLTDLTIILDSEAILGVISIKSLKEVKLSTLSLPIAILEQEAQVGVALSSPKIGLVTQPILLRNQAWLRRKRQWLVCPVIRLSHISDSVDRGINLSILREESCWWAGGVKTAAVSASWEDEFECCADLSG